MANKRITDLTSTETRPRKGVFIETDHATEGSKKMDVGIFDELIMSRAPADYLHSDGATSNRRIETVYGAVGAFAGSDTTVVGEPWDVPTSNPSARATIWAATSSNSADPAGVAWSLGLYLETNGDLVLLQNGATPASDFRKVTWSGWRATYSGRRIRPITAFTGGSSTTPTHYQDGSELSGGVATDGAGTDPNWVSSSTATTYFLQGYAWPAGYFRPGRPVNRKYAQADVDFVQLTGRLPAPDAAGATQTNDMSGNDSTFSGAGNWLGIGTTSAAVSGGQLVVTGLTNSGSNCLQSPTWLQSTTTTKRPGRRYRVTMDVVAVTLSGGATAIDVYCPVYSGATPIGSITSTGAKVFDFDYISGGSDASAMLQFFRREASGTANITIDNVVLKTIGALSEPIIQPIQVVADAGPNAVGSLVVGFAPVTSRKEWVIQDATSTNGNEQILGGSVFAFVNKSRIDSWTINNAGSSRTVSLGNVSSGTQYLSGGTAAAGLTDVTLAARHNATVNLWVNSNGTDVLQHTIHGRRID